MGALEAVKMFREDHGDANPPSGFRKDFAEDKPYKSFLQRRGKTLKEVLEELKWDKDDTLWRAEYGKAASEGEQDIDKLIRYRRRMSFAIGAWRDFNEDFGRGDVSCLRDLRTPLVTSRTPLFAMENMFSEKEEE